MVLGEGILNLGLFLPRYEVGMGVACSTFMVHLKKSGYTGHLQLDRMRKSPMEWGNMYDAGEDGSQRTIFANDDRKLVVTIFPTIGPWF